MSLITESAVQSTAPQSSGVAERVLIVEDDAPARVGLEQLVKSWGFAAASATDGEEALEKVTTDRKSTRLNSSHIQKSRMPSSA